MAAKKSYFNRFHEFFQFITQLGFAIFCKFRYKLIVKGRENIPKDTHNYIVVSNHQSYYDIPILAYVFGGYVAFIAKQELFDMPFLGLWLSLTGTITVNRDKPEASLIKKAKSALTRENWKVGIFIEGTRSKIEGQLGVPNIGPLYISKLTKSQIIPVGIIYKGKNEVQLKIGEPFYPNDQDDLEEQSWQCLEKISKLCKKQLPPKVKLETN